MSPRIKKYFAISFPIVFRTIWSVITTATVVAMLTSLSLNAFCQTEKADQPFQTVKSQVALSRFAALLSQQVNGQPLTAAQCEIEGVASYPSQATERRVVMKLNGTNQMRTEVYGVDKVAVEVVRNRHSAHINQGIVNPGRSAKNSIGVQVRQLPWLSLLVDLLDRDTTVEYRQNSGTLAIETVSAFYSPATDRASAKVFESITRHDFDLDASGAIVELRFKRFSENHPNSFQDVRVVFSGYKAIQGVNIPLEQDTYVNNQLESRLAIQSVNLTPALSPSDFDISGEVPYAKK